MNKEKKQNSGLSVSMADTGVFFLHIDFRDAFPADSLIRHLQHTGTIAGFGLIAVDNKILVYLGTVIMECVLCTV